MTINAVMRDSEANLWFASAGKGVFRLGSAAFKNMRFPDRGNELSVCSIQQFSSSLLVGTEKFFLWRIGPGAGEIHKQKVHANARDRGRIIAIEPIDKKSLLLATDGGVIKLTNFIQSFSNLNTSVKSISRFGKKFLISTGNTVLLNTDTGLRSYEGIWNGRSTCSYGKDSLIYVGTLSGLFTLAPGKKISFLGTEDTIFRNRISDIKEAPDGLLWIATSGGGIAVCKDGRLLYTLSEKDGLSSNICKNLFLSGEDIWVGTDKGLNRVHQNGGDHKQGGGFRVTTLTSVDGLCSNIINAVYANANYVYVGTDKGMTYFRTNEAESNSFCKLRITAIRTTAHVWEYDTSDLSLPHYQSAIQVEFAGISYRSAGEILYRYRLRGLSDAWQTTRETFVSYPTLPSGEYELELTATNKFGVQSGRGSIKFSVKKLLWEEKWFIILAIVAGAGGLWALIMIRTKKLKRQNQDKIDINNRMAELEQMALKAQMNPHFIFNSLNSIQKYVITKDIRGANKFVSDFARLMRLTLEISSKSRISIEEEVKYLSTYLELERIRFDNKFQYDIHVDPAIDLSAQSIPPMILQPFVENSIRHGVRYRDDDKGRITVSFLKNDLFLVCIVEDNGIGRELARQYKSRTPMEYQSRGMALTERRIEMMNRTQATAALISIEDLETSDRRPAGTRITLQFPLRHTIHLNL